MERMESAWDWLIGGLSDYWLIDRSIDSFTGWKEGENKHHPPPLWLYFLDTRRSSIIHTDTGMAVLLALPRLVRLSLPITTTTMAVFLRSASPCHHRHDGLPPCSAPPSQVTDTTMAIRIPCSAPPPHPPTSSRMMRWSLDWGPISRCSRSASANSSPGRPSPPRACVRAGFGRSVGWLVGRSTQASKQAGRRKCTSVVPFFQIIITKTHTGTHTHILSSIKQ